MIIFRKRQSYLVVTKRVVNKLLFGVRVYITKTATYIGLNKFAIANLWIFIFPQKNSPGMDCCLIVGATPLQVLPVCFLFKLQESYVPMWFWAQYLRESIKYYFADFFCWGGSPSTLLCTISLMSGFQNIYISSSWATNYKVPVFLLIFLRQFFLRNLGVWKNSAK